MKSAVSWCMDLKGDLYFQFLETEEPGAWRSLSPLGLILGT